MKIQKKIPRPKRPKTPEAQRKLNEYGNLMKRRGEWARQIVAAQDQETRQAIEELVEVISAMADKSGKARVETARGNVTLTVPNEIFEDGWLWVAVRLCIAAHEWDILIANFKPPRKRTTK